MSEGSKIVRVAARGDGVSGDGRHASLAAPGDLLRADGTLIYGSHHREPPCRHFPECGGCQLQHLDDESYAAFLTDRISGALAAQGIETTIRPPILSPERTRRRTTLHAERRGSQLHIGFTEEKSHRLIDLAECHVLHPALFALIQPIRGLLNAVMPRSGRVDLHLALADQGIDVLIKGERIEGLKTAAAITGFSRKHALARLSIDEGFGPEARWEPEPVTIMLGGVPVGMPPGAFLQATREGEAALVAAVLEITEDARIVADLFAGLGTFALALGTERRVYAAEAARDAILSLKAAANLAQRQIAADHRDLYRSPVGPSDLNRFDCVILDPPRAGAKEEAAAIAASTVAKVAYISCNPSSFARDAKALCEAGYTLEWVQPVGQFRWSTHAELAACFQR